MIDLPRRSKSRQTKKKRILQNYLSIVRVTMMVLKSKKMGNVFLNYLFESVQLVVQIHSITINN